MTTATGHEAGDWAFYEDGAESSSNLISSANVDPVLRTDTVYQFRQVIEEVLGAVWNFPNLKLQYSVNSDSWNDVSERSEVVKSASSADLTDAGFTTERLTSSVNLRYRSYKGISTYDGEVYDDISILKEYINVLFSFVILSDDVEVTDTIRLRVIEADDTELSNYQQQYPQISIEGKPQRVHFTLPETFIVGQSPDTASEIKSFRIWRTDGSLYESVSITQSNLQKEWTQQIRSGVMLVIVVYQERYGAYDSNGVYVERFYREFMRYAPTGSADWLVWYDFGTNAFGTGTFAQAPEGVEYKDYTDSALLAVDNSDNDLDDVVQPWDTELRIAYATEYREAT